VRVATRDVRPGSQARTRRARSAPAAAPAAAVGDGLVVGPVPGPARAVGVLLVLAGLCGGAALVPTYLVVGGRELALAAGPAAVAVALLQPLAHLAVGAVLSAGRVPRFGLAYAALGGVLATGSLFIEVYRGQAATTRPGIELLAGELVLTSTVEAGQGWVLAVVSAALVVVAGVLALAVWGRTVMDDRGALDPVRPALAGTAFLLGVLGVLALSLPAADVPDDLVTDPLTGLVTVVPREGPQALLERPGLALLGGLLLAGAVLLASVVAPSLRPRLAAVGGLLAVTVPVLSAGLTGWRDAAASEELEWTVPGVGLLLAGVGYAVLTLLAWRLRRRTAPRG
jgi:hypothetical protein